MVLLLKQARGRSNTAASTHRNRMFKARPMIMENSARIKLSLREHWKKQRISTNRRMKISSQLTTRCSCRTEHTVNSA